MSQPIIELTSGEWEKCTMYNDEVNRIVRDITKVLENKTTVIPTDLTEFLEQLRVAKETRGEWAWWLIKKAEIKYVKP